MRTPGDFRANERAVAMTSMLYTGSRITRELIMRRFNVSRATAGRDMVTLELFLPVIRSNGHLQFYPVKK